MNEPIETWPDVPRGVLATLLDLSGLPGALSPRRLMGSPSVLTLDQLVELYACDILSEPSDSPEALTERFRRAAATLRTPRLNITLRQFCHDGACIESNVQFPGPAFDGRGVALNQVGTRYRISAFADDRALIELATATIPPPAGAAPEPFEALLDPVQALALAALVDRSADGPVPAASIDAYIREHWGVTGFDALLTYAVVATGLPSAPSLAQVSAALSDLVALDLATNRAEGGFTMGPATAPMMAAWRGMSRGLQWQRASEEGGRVVLSDRIFLFGESGHALAVSRGVSGRVHVATLARDGVVSFIAHELASSALPGASPPTPPARTKDVS